MLAVFALSSTTISGASSGLLPMTQPVFATADLCDIHAQDGSAMFRVLPPVFRDFGATRPFHGSVLTVRALEDNSRVREAVNTPGAGRVLVVDGGASLRHALVGGNLAAAAMRNGWAGLVIDGCVRDVIELRACGLPVRALASMPVAPRKSGEGVAGQPVQIQGIRVYTGDWLYADDDGIVLADRQLI